MTFQNYPRATATTTVDEWVIDEPAHAGDVDLKTSFETGGTSGWNAGFWADVSISSTQARTGTKSLRISRNSEPSDPQEIIQANYSHSGSSQYAFWAKAAAGSTLKVSTDDPEGGPPLRVSYPMTGSWVLVQVISTESLGVDLIGATEVFIDDLLIREWIGATYTKTPTLKLADGDLTLDSGKYPYAQASVTVPLPDSALLEQIEPGARVQLNASAQGEWVKSYTPWVDVRRNLVPVTQPTVYAGSGWAAAGGTIAAPGWIGATINSATTAYIFTDGAESAITAGTQITMSVTYKVTALGTGTAATHIRAVPHIRTGNVYLTPTLQEMQDQGTLRPIVLNQEETVVLHWTADRAIAAGELDIALTSSADQGSFTSVTGGFAWRATRVIIEKGNTSGEFFDGSTRNDEFERTEWEGTTNASTSTLEVRSVERVDWWQDAGITADLHLVERQADHDGKELTLRLASDEAILEGWAPLADDKGPRAFENNLRNLVQYVIGQAIPSAYLEPGTANADLTARWNATNSVLNPDCVNGGAAYTGAGNVTVSYSASTGGQGPSTGYVTGTSAAAGQSFIAVPQSVSTRKGDMWTFSAYMHKANSLTGTQNGILRVYEMDSAGAVLRQIESTPKALLPSGTGGAGGYVWDRHSLTFTVQNPNTTKLALYTSMMATAAGQGFGIDSVMLTEGPLLLEYFSGSRTPAGYVTNWTGQSAPVPNNSVSERTPADGIVRMPELFTWRAGDSAWKFLEPLTTSAGLRLFCDEQRRWWLIDPSGYTVPGRFSARPDNTVEGTDTMDADDDETGITGVVAVFNWTDEDGVSQEAKESAGLPGKVKPLEFNRPFTPGVAAAHLTKVQGQNRTQDVTCGVDYAVRPGMEVQIDLPGTNAQLGTLTGVKFELTNGLMSVQSAGLRDTPPGSIDLLNGTIDGLPGSIDSL